MTGKTHIAVGLAASSLLLPHPQNRIELGIFFGFAVIGALMPDVDQKQSILGHIINVIIVSVLVVLLVLRIILFLPQYTTLIQNSTFLNYVYAPLTETFGAFSNVLTIIGCVQLLINIIAARLTGHRHFAHSFLGLFSFSACIYLLFGLSPLKPFFVGFVSHMIIDLFNYRQEKLFFPYKRGVAFNLVRTGSTVDHLLAFIGIAIFLAFNLT
jgi:inner membrane protein